MKRYLLIDDIRTPAMVMPPILGQKASESYSIDVARTYQEGARLLNLSMRQGKSYFMLLLDHDLGDEKEKNGYMLIKNALDFCHGRTGNVLKSRLNRLPEYMECVSDNGPGRANIISIFKKIEELRNES